MKNWLLYWILKLHHQMAFACTRRLFSLLCMCSLHNILYVSSWYESVCFCDSLRPKELLSCFVFYTRTHTYDWRSKNKSTQLNTVKHRTIFLSKKKIKKNITEVQYARHSATQPICKESAQVLATTTRVRQIYYITACSHSNCLL